MSQDEEGVSPTPQDSDFHDAMQAFAEIRRQYRDALEKLAVSRSDADSTDIDPPKA